MSEVPLYGWYDTLALERSSARDAAHAGFLPLSRYTLGVLDTRPSVSITVSDTRKCAHQCVRHARVCLSMCPTRLGVPITVYITPQCVDTLALERSPPPFAAQPCPAFQGSDTLGLDPKAKIPRLRCTGG